MLSLCMESTTRESAALAGASAPAVAVAAEPSPPSPNPPPNDGNAKTPPDDCISESRSRTTIHPRPTLSETVMFAAEAAEGTITDLYLPQRARAGAAR